MLCILGTRAPTSDQNGKEYPQRALVYVVGGSRQDMAQDKTFLVRLSTYTFDQTIFIVHLSLHSNAKSSFYKGKHTCRNEETQRRVSMTNPSPHP